MDVTKNDIVFRVTTRHNSRERNSNHTNALGRHHPPNGGIMSPKMHFRDISRRDKSLAICSTPGTSTHPICSNYPVARFSFPFLKIALTPSDTTRGIAHPLRAAFLLASLPPWRAP
jgi:hypothetical protein